MNKSFTINEAPYSIRCLMYHNGGTSFGRVVICCHGFGGHKENGAMKHFAEYVLSKYKDLAVLCFDWPCHGEDARRKLELHDCDEYLRLVTEYARDSLGAQEIYLYATSFGGYLTLKYISEHGNPFKKIALRCPAVNMYEVFTASIMTDENRALLDKGKDAMVGFDRKIKLSRAFLDEVCKADITSADFLDYADNIMILHGTKDEIVPIEAVRDFAENNVIDFIPVKNADHRFIDPKIMKESIIQIAEFFELSQQNERG